MIGEFYTQPQMRQTIQQHNGEATNPAWIVQRDVIGVGDQERAVGLWVLSCPRPANAGTPCPAAG